MCTMITAINYYLLVLSISKRTANKSTLTTANICNKLDLTADQILILDENILSDLLDNPLAFVDVSNPKSISLSNLPISDDQFLEFLEKYGKDIERLEINNCPRGKRNICRSMLPNLRHFAFSNHLKDDNLSIGDKTWKIPTSWFFTPANFPDIEIIDDLTINLTLSKVKIENRFCEPSVDNQNKFR